MMSAKRLPLGRPPLKGYHYLAYPLSVMALHQDYLPWFHTHFIQLSCSTNFLEIGVMNFDFYNYDFTRYPLPWLDMQRMHRDIACPPGEDIIAFIKRCIEANCYVYLFLNEYFIPDKRSYEIEDFAHDNFIFGFDEEAGHLDMLGYNKDGVFTTSRLSFAAFRRAYGQMEIVKDELNYIHLFRYDPARSYAFDPTLAAGLLGDYVNGRNSSYRFAALRNPEELIFGMRVYDALRIYFDALWKREIPYDIRPLYILWEHKACMASRIRFLENERYLPAKSDLTASGAELEQMSRILKLTQLKFNVTEDRKTFMHLGRGIDKLEARERVILTELLDIFPFGSGHRETAS